MNSSNVRFTIVFSGRRKRIISKFSETGPLNKLTSLDSMLSFTISITSELITSYGSPHLELQLQSRARPFQGMTIQVMMRLILMEKRVDVRLLCPKSHS